ncbi:hypothetical protein DERP_003981, partial [Dermatophagoides pteronyssinus]
LLLYIGFVRTLFFVNSIVIRSNFDSDNIFDTINKIENSFYFKYLYNNSNE